jgi:hypothetical protein
VAASAFPVPVLTISDGHTQTMIRLADRASYVYSYVNSVYDAPVEERHVRTNDRLRITSVRSPDIRAVEYFRWDGAIKRVDNGFEQVAPPNETERLTIRITPRYQQRLAGAGWSVDLPATFGDGVVQVTPRRLPILLALFQGIHA